MREILVIFLIIFTLFSCKNDSVHEKKIQATKPVEDVSNADIIRSPVSADEMKDTANVAKIAFKETFFDFGEVNEGDIINHTFSFTNTGTIPLIIKGARSTCGCTVPSWPKERIQPGQTGKIKVVFKTKGKPGNQKKPITITANTYPSTSKILLKGKVIPKKRK